MRSNAHQDWTLKLIERLFPWHPHSGMSVPKQLQGQASPCSTWIRYELDSAAIQFHTGGTIVERVEAFRQLKNQSWYTMRHNINDVQRLEIETAHSLVAVVVAQVVLHEPIEGRPDAVRLKHDRLFASEWTFVGDEQAHRNIMSMMVLSCG